MKKNPFHSIKSKLLILGLSISLIPIAAITSVYYFKTRYVMERQIVQYLAMMSEAKKAHILGYLESKKGQTIDFCSDGFIRDSLARIFHGKHSERGIVNALNKHLIRNKMSLDPDIVAITVTDLNGEVVAATIESLIGEDLSKQELYSHAFKENTNKPFVIKPHLFPYLLHDGAVLDIVAPVTSRLSSKRMGYLINHYRLSTLDKITTQRIGMGETGETYLVTRDKVMLTVSRFIDSAPLRQLVDTEPVHRIIEAAKEMVGIYSDYRGVPVIGVSMNISEYGWILLAEIDKAEAFAPLRNLRIYALIISCVSVVVTCIAGILFAVSTSRPINLLKKATERFKAGNLDYRVTTDRKDELGALAESFNDMAESLAMEMKSRKIAEEKIINLSFAVEQSSNIVIITDTAGNIEYVNTKFTEVTGYTPEEVIGRNPRILKSDKTPREEYKQLWETITNGKEWRGEFYNKKKNGEFFWTSESISPIRNPDGIITHFVGSQEDITEQKQNERRRTAQYAVTRSLAESAMFEEAIQKTLNAICECLEWDFGSFWMVDHRSNVLHCTKSWQSPSVKVQEFLSITHAITFSSGVGLPGRVWASGKPAWIADVTQDPNFPRGLIAAKEGLHGAFAFPVRIRDEIVGVIECFSHEVKQPDVDLLDMMAAIGGQVGLFVKRRQAEERVRQQLRRLAALHEIDMAIVGTLDLNIMLNVFLEKAVAHLNVDAASILLLDEFTQVLEYGAGTGFRTDAIQRSRVHLGEGTAGRAALDQKTISIPDLRKAGDTFSRAELLEGEDFSSYYVKPLIAKGNIMGVLEIFHRTQLNPDHEWLQFLEALTTQGALAVADAMLFNKLQRSNIELVMAYDDTTLQGWSRALDLRDKETEGHSSRVTEMTVQIAVAMGVSKAELVHIRRGAMLHDIGKLGVPDNILLKVDKLTDEEWAIMSKHPVYAYEMLVPIAYLRQALDIPYCHHEKWDGTGYPRGLKGEEIPLSARIFAVVDVWDALRSDRPYRKGWSEEKVCEHIKSLAGTHFDPKVVDVFLKMKR